jgi:hypothetical protein
MRAARIAGAVAVIGIMIGFGMAPSASASRAVHAGETITVSQSTGLADGQTVTVSFTNFTPNAKPVKVVIAGQTGFTTVPDKLNFAEYAVAPSVPVNPDGTGSIDYVVKIDHGIDNVGNPLVCGQNGQQCWLTVIQEPFLPQPNYAQQEIFFGSAGPATTAAPVATAAPTTAAPTTTSAPATTTTEKPVVTPAATTDDSGSNTGLIIGIAAAAVVLLGGLGFILSRRGSVVATGRPAVVANAGSAHRSVSDPASCHGRPSTRLVPLEI